MSKIDDYLLRAENEENAAILVAGRLPDPRLALARGKAYLAEARRYRALAEAESRKATKPQAGTTTVNKGLTPVT